MGKDFLTLIACINFIVFRPGMTMICQSVACSYNFRLQLRYSRISITRTPIPRSALFLEAFSKSRPNAYTLTLTIHSIRQTSIPRIILFVEVIVCSPSKKTILFLEFGFFHVVNSSTIVEN